MARDMARYFLRVVLIIGLCWALGPTRCASVPIQQQVVEQQTANTAAKKTAAQYIPPGPDRDQVFNALDGSSDLMGRQNQKLQKETARADQNQEAADLVFWLKWAGRLAIIGAAAWGALQIGRKIPIVKNWLPG